jgi:hypothetical protein
MHTIAEAFTEIVRLIGDMFRLWWKNLVPLLTWFLAGYIAFMLATQGAIWLQVHQHKNFAIGLFSAGVLAQLVAVVGMIRTIAGSLYRWRDAAAGPGETTDPTQRRLLELLSITLLPLIAVWSAWGILDARLDIYAGFYLSSEGSFEHPFKLGGGAWKAYLPAIAVLLVLRRMAEGVDDRWPSRSVKLLQVWVEAFFALLVVIVAPPAISTAKNWIEGREAWFFTTDRWESLTEWFAGISIPIPDGLEFLWGVFHETLWPLFKEGVADPLTWLAITTVVFGHRALSAGSFVRGTRLESRIGTQSSASQGRAAAIAGKAPDLVLGGLKEKFIPTLNAFRLLVRVGPVFLGVVCVVYSLHDVAYQWFYTGITHWIGDRGNSWTVLWTNVVDLAGSAIFEPLRIALLAAAFDQAISVGIQQQQSEAAREKRAEQRETVPATA